MKNIKKGTKFLVCGHEELMDLGWWEEDEDLPGVQGQRVAAAGAGHYYHDNFKTCSITFRMITENEGKILTVNDKESAGLWYWVKENHYEWPVSTFLRHSTHTCEEGMTPLDGWFICKICGNDLREIK